MLAQRDSPTLGKTTARTLQRRLPHGKKPYLHLRQRLAFEPLEERALLALDGNHILTGAGFSNEPQVRAFDPADLSESTNLIAYDLDFTGGVRVAGGDVNRDGTPDIVTGNGPGRAAELKVFNGLDNSLLMTIAPYAPAFTGGICVATGDVDGDGFDDLITGAGYNGGPHVKVFSGADGSLLREFLAYLQSFTGGVSVAAADFTGDGLADIVTGAGRDGGPHVRVFDGFDGSRVQEYFAYGADFTGGIYVAAADINGDSQADVITGAGSGGSPHVRVFDGLDGTPLRDLFAYDPAFTGGVTVAAGDINADGRPDLITGPGPSNTSDVPFIGPRVRIFNGVNSTELSNFLAHAPTFTGGVFVGWATISNQPPSIANHALTTNPGVQQQPSVAVNPHDPNHVAIAYMDYSLPTVDTSLPGEGYAGIGVAVSHDGGTTWQHSAIPLPEPFNEGAANPIAAFDDEGRVFVTFMAATFLGTRPHLTNMDIFNPTRNASDREYGFQSNNGIFVTRSDDGGLTWNEPATVVSHLFDGENEVNFEIIPAIGIDTYPVLPNGQPNPNHQNVYVTWSRIYVPGQFPGNPDVDGSIDIMIAVSRDGGETWETQFQEKIDDNGDPFLATVIEDSLNTFGLVGLSVVDQPRISIGPAGEIYVAHGGCGDFAVPVSRDGGATFDEPDHATGHRIAFGIGCATATSIIPLPNNSFRKNFVRAIAADPTRPGRVYAADNIDVFESDGDLIGPDVIFASSDDQGETWHEFNVGGVPAVLNDDNDGRKATGVPEDVIAGQVMTRLVADAQGNLGVIWVDTRRDPADHLLDVFGTISTDGGQTFSPNFRITNVSFDADQGRFTNAVGSDEFYIGDFIGLAMANNTAYAAWTDTRNGNQDIFFARYSVSPAPQELNDRFEPNDTPELDATPTMLGRVVQRLLPNLTADPGDPDWFSLETAATGDLIASAIFESESPLESESLRLEIRDETGDVLLATASDLFDQEGNLVGREARVAAVAGERFLVRVSGDGSEAVHYSLRLQSLTANLGTRAYASVGGTVTAGGGALYLVNAAAPGSMEFKLTGGANVQGDLNLQVLDAQTLAVVRLGQPGPAVTAPSAEPNDSINEANPTGLAQPGSVTIDSTIGDGSFGATSGDLDYYGFEAGANQRITVDLNVVAVGSSLDGLVALYDASGELLQVVDAASTGVNEVLMFTTDEADTYFVAVMGFQSFPPGDPFTSGTGSGGGSTGAFRLTITAEEKGPGAREQASLPVRQGQGLLVLVAGDDTTAGDFTLEITNFDQFTTPDKNTLFFQPGAGPSQAAIGDLNRDGNLDVVVTDVPSDTISLLAGNGDGTFQAPRQLAIGAFIEPPPGDLTRLLPTFGRDVTIADFNEDGIPDTAVTNLASSDVSVLLGRGDGGFEPQRRFDATSSPIALEAADLNGDDFVDLAVVSSGTPRRTFMVATLLGRGDGTFQPQATIEVPTLGEVFNLGAIQIGELDGDGVPDLAVSGSGNPDVAILRGNGDGTFTLSGQFPAARLSVGMALADLNEDGNLDILNTGFDHHNQVTLLLGTGAGAFQTPREFVAGQNPVALAAADLGSQVELPDGSTVLGPPDGHPDVVVAVSGVLVSSIQVEGPPSVVVLPALFDDQGQFDGLGASILLAPAEAPQDIDIGDINNDGALDVVAVDREGVLVIFGQPPVIVPNDTPETARNLGTVVHMVQQTLTIVPDHEDAYFKLTVPTEAAAGAGDQVLDFSALFQHTEGAGLQMEVRDSAGTLLGFGERFRVRARQGEELTLHVFGVAGAGGLRGSGAYTLDIVALPQVVSVEAQSLLPGVGANPGGPTTSLVVTLQGERLDPATAENAANYRVTWWGPDRVLGTADDEVVPLNAGAGMRSVVYTPSGNVDVASGITFPTAVEQTVTLLFDQAMPAGSYSVELLPAIQAAAFSEDEDDLLSPAAGFMGHPVVSLADGPISPGSQTRAVDLVLAEGALGDFGVWEAGTPFLSQLHDDLGALLDALLTQQGDDPTITAALADQVLGRITSSLGPRGARPAPVLVMFFDPVSIDLEDPDGDHIDYDQGDGTLVNDIDNVFVDVGGNVEVIVLSTLGGLYELVLSNVPARARAGVIFVDNDGEQIMELTDDLRAGITEFSLMF